MFRRFLVVAALGVAVWPCGPAGAAYNDLVPQAAASQFGLVRPWFAQLAVDSVRGRVTNAILCEGVLYVQTDAAIVQAIDAKNGTTLWTKRLGQADHPSMALEAKGNLLAMINGSRLYLVNRTTGDLLSEKDIRGCPSAGPALSSKRVYVPTATGMILAYTVDSLLEGNAKKDVLESGETAKVTSKDQHGLPVLKYPPPPKTCQSYGRATIQPLVTRDNSGGEYVVWPTDLGYLNFGHIDPTLENAFTIKQRLESEAKTTVRPGYLPPDPHVTNDSGTVFVATDEGNILAIRDENGVARWQFSTGEPITQSPAALEDRIYVATAEGGMYCLDSATGRNLWRSPNVTQFVAAGRNRVYGRDNLGHLLVINAGSGEPLGALDVSPSSMLLANTDTDRIYVIGDDGLVQCLHEASQTKPILWNHERKEAAKTVPKPAAEEKKTEKPKKATHGSAPAPHATPAPKPKKEPTPKQPRRPRRRGDQANQAPGAGPNQPAPGGPNRPGWHGNNNGNGLGNN